MKFWSEEGPSSTQWVDFNFYGHQLVIHEHPKTVSQESVHSKPVDGHDGPVPHFGVILGGEEWEALAERLKSFDTRFVIEPYIRFKGQVGEPATMFLFMRQHIIDVAKSLMTNKGYTAVGLAEVLSTAGVPKGSFYHYFRSKEEFGQALLEEYFQEYIGRVDIVMAAEGTGAERLLGYLRYWAQTQAFDHPEEKCLVVKLGAEVCDLSEDMRTELEEGTALIIQRITRCVEQGMTDGSISTTQDAPTLAESLYQLWLGASLLVKVRKTTTPFETALITSERLLGQGAPVVRR